MTLKNNPPPKKKNKNKIESQFSDPVRHFEEKFPIRRKTTSEIGYNLHMACHDYTPNIGGKAVSSVRQHSYR